MVRFLAALAALLLFASCSSAEDGERVNARSTCDYVTFARFAGIRYVPSRTNDGLRGATLGAEYARVTRQLSRDIEICHDQTVTDGDATDVSPDTPFYQVQGFPPQFVLATEIGLWEADYDPAAQTGGDVLDIGSSVRQIAILSGPLATSELGSVDESTTIGAFFEAVLHAPVVRDTDQRGTFQRYWLRFEMEDGLVFARFYRPDTGELGNGIMLPDPARAIIADAVAR